MAGLLDMLTGQLAGGNLKKISGQLGADENTTMNAIGTALPMLLGALSRNASNEDGARALSNALDKDHDGSILNNLTGFLDKPEEGPGDGILRHVLGARRPAVEAGLSKSTGLDAGSVGKLLMTLAPVVLGMLGQKKRQQGMDASGLAGLLSNERQDIERRAPKEMGFIGKLLDSDGDGQVDIGEIAKGVGFLGKLFGKR
jgi:hypothetical protein